MVWQWKQALVLPCASWRSLWRKEQSIYYHSMAGSITMTLSVPRSCWAVTKSVNLNCISKGAPVHAEGCYFTQKHILYLKHQERSYCKVGLLWYKPSW